MLAACGCWRPPCTRRVQGVSSPTAFVIIQIELHSNARGEQQQGTTPPQYRRLATVFCSTELSCPSLFQSCAVALPEAEQGPWHSVAAGGEGLPLSTGTATLSEGALGARETQLVNQKEEHDTVGRQLPAFILAGGC